MEVIASIRLFGLHGLMHGPHRVFYLSLQFSKQIPLRRGSSSHLTRR